MNYAFTPVSIKIGVESKQSCPATSSTKFVDTLQGVYEDMKTMCIQSQLNSKL